MSDIVINDSTNGSGGTNQDSTQDSSTTTNLVDVNSLNLVPLSETTPTEGDVLVYKGSYYIPSKVGLSFLSDVDDLTSVEDKEILYYDSSTSTWKPESLDSLLNSNLQFDTVKTPVESDILSYNGTSWVPVSKEVLLNSYSLSNIEDVTLSNLIDKQVLSYDSINNKWVNKTLSLSNLSGFMTTSLKDQDFLVFNADNNSWVNKTIDFGGLESLDFSSIEKHSVLKYNVDTREVEAQSLESFISSVKEKLKINDLSDVDISSISDKKVLQFNSNTNQWEASELDIDSLKSINLSNVQHKDILRYNSISSSWETVPLNPNQVFDFLDSSVRTGKTLVYNEVNAKWEPRYLTLNDLIDKGVPASTIEKGSTIIWDSNTNSWKYKKLNLSDLLDSSNISEDSISVFKVTDGSWKVISLSELNTSSLDRIHELEDVELVGSLTDDKILGWDSSKNKWISKSLSVSNLGDVDLNSLYNGNFLEWNSSTNKWKSTNIDLNKVLGTSVDFETLDNLSSPVWNSLTKSWEVRKKTLVETLGLYNLSEGDTLVWDSTQNRWEVKNFNEVTNFPETVEELNNVEIFPADLRGGEIILYNSSTNKWISKELSLDDISNIVTSNLNEGDVLAWNSTFSRLEPKKISSLILEYLEEYTLEDFKDTDFNNLSEGNLVFWDTTTSKWKNSFISPKNYGLNDSDNYEGKYIYWNPNTSLWEVGELNLSTLLGIDDESAIEDRSIAIWNSDNSKWELVGAYDLNKDIAGEIDLGELKNVEAPDKLHNQILTWDSAVYKWMPKSLSDLGAVSGTSLTITGNDWVTRFNNGINY